ncbi:hypothetical protein B0H21DRAFT_762418 [Amylocystis lapponica]|nr:hypothetical protein B0H21DRAFT_762418 [Amylocystis lapponica]
MILTMRATTVIALAFAAAMPVLSVPFYGGLGPEIIHPSSLRIFSGLSTRQISGDSGTVYHTTFVPNSVARGWNSREIMEEYARRELQENGSGASFLGGLIKHGPKLVEHLFGGSSGNSSRRGVELMSALAARQVQLDDGSGAVSIAKILEGTARGALQGAEKAWDTREILDEYVRRELQEEGGGASFLRRIGKLIPKVTEHLFGGSSGNHSRRDLELMRAVASRQAQLDNGSGAFSVEHVLNGALHGALQGAEKAWDTRKVVDGYVRRELEQEGSGANWILSLGKHLLGDVFSGSSGNSSRRNTEFMSALTSRQVQPGGGSSAASFLKLIEGSARCDTLVAES